MVTDWITRAARRQGSNLALQAGGPRWTWPFASSGPYANVNDDVALGLTAVYRCVVLISTTIASLPMHTYEEDKEGNSTRIKPWTLKYLWDRPNKEMTRQTFWETVIGHEVLGDAFLFVVKNDVGMPLELYYIEPWRVQTGRASTGQKVYFVDGKNVLIDFVDGGEIIHVPNWSRDSLRGVSPIRAMSRSISLGLSSEDAAVRAMNEDSSPSGVLQSDQTIPEDVADALLTRWRQRTSGGNKTVLLAGGVKYQPVGINPSDVQLLEERRFQLGEFGRAFGVPPHMIGDTERTTSWGTGVSEQTTGFLRFTLQAHISRFEQAINDALLKRGETSRFIKFELGGLLRPTLYERYQAYALAFGKWMTSNGIRSLEDMEPLDGGDILLAPLNMGAVEDVIDPPEPKPAPPPSPPVAAPTTNGNGRV